MKPVTREVTNMDHNTTMAIPQDFVGWVHDGTTTGNATSATLTVSCSCNSIPCDCYTIYNNYIPWSYSYDPKITLTLTEVEHLRKLAKSDKRLRATLRKFAPYIAIKVDFPG